MRPIVLRARTSGKTAEMLRQAAERLNTLEKRVRMLEEALRFYRDEWLHFDSSQSWRFRFHLPTKALYDDAGELARKALKGE